MAKPTNVVPTHMPVVFCNSAHMQRIHVSGASQDEGDGQMIVCLQGEEKRIVWNIAKDLIIAKTALAANDPANKDAIAEIRQDAKDAKERAEKRAKDPANKHETLDQKIERIVANAMDTILAKLSQPGKKAA